MAKKQNQMLVLNLRIFGEFRNHVLKYFWSLFCICSWNNLFPKSFFLHIFHWRTYQGARDCFETCSITIPTSFIPVSPGRAWGQLPWTLGTNLDWANGCARQLNDFSSISIGWKYLFNISVEQKNNLPYCMHMKCEGFELVYGIKSLLSHVPALQSWARRVTISQFFHLQNGHSTNFKRAQWR